MEQILEEDELLEEKHKSETWIKESAEGKEDQEVGKEIYNSVEDVQTQGGNETFGVIGVDKKADIVKDENPLSKAKNKGQSIKYQAKERSTMSISEPGTKKRKTELFIDDPRGELFREDEASVISEQKETLASVKVEIKRTLTEKPKEENDVSKDAKGKNIKKPKKGKDHNVNKTKGKGKNKLKEEDYTDETKFGWREKVESLQDTEWKVKRLASVTSRESSDTEKLESDRSNDYLDMDKEVSFRRARDSTKHLKRRTRKRKKTVSRQESVLMDEPCNLNIEGVVQLTILPATQTFLGCVIEQDVTAESPWVYVKKFLIDENLVSQEEDSEFFSIRENINNYVGEQMLIGFDPTSDYPNKFYVCTTQAAHDAVVIMIEKEKEEQRVRLLRCLERPVQKWKSLGSERDIEEMIIHDKRPLYEKHVETVIDRVNKPAQFQDADFDSIKNGYTNLLPLRANFDNVEKKRLEVAIQAVPEMSSTKIQTYYGVPTNMGTQYEFEGVSDKTLDDDQVSTLNRFLSENENKFICNLDYNNVFDMYKDEYLQLVVKDKVSEITDKIRFIEYQSFTDVTLCKGKLISYVAWHPMWTGVVAVSYVSNTRCNIAVENPNVSEVAQAALANNPVLIWSFNDGLRPKLILDCPQEVHAIRFCPFNENLIVGGCINGQVLIWDITNRLQRVEEDVSLTSAQMMYRHSMKSLITWMKDTHKLSHVQPAVASSLEFSHGGCVTQVKWISPHWQISKTGRFLPLSEEQSLQFLTSGEDGVVSVWDMNAKFTPLGMVKPKRGKKSRRRREALEVDISPLHSLNLVFRPIFKIMIAVPKETSCIPLSALSYFCPNIDYAESEPVERKESLTTRIMYSAVLAPNIEEPKYEMHVGSIDGQVLLITWAGYEFNTGEAVTSETCGISSRAGIHDGPVISVVGSPFFNDILLSVGGKEFAIWKDNLKNSPLFWRRSKIKLTDCVWSTYKPSTFLISRVDGSIEVWDLLNRCDKPTLVQSISGRILTGIHSHNLGPMKGLMGVSDYDGSFRVFHIPPVLTQCGENDKDHTYKLFEHEVTRRDNFNRWQSTWVQHNKDFLDKMKDTVEPTDEEKKEEIVFKPKPKVEKRCDQLDPIEELSKIQTRSTSRCCWTQVAKGKLRMEQHRHMVKTLLEKKRLDKVELIIEKQPPLKLKEIEKEKKRKQQDKLRHQHMIFEDTLAVLFPDTIDSTALHPKQQKVIKESLDGKKQEFTHIYKDTETEILNFVKNHPYAYSFDWNKVLNDGYDRRQTIDVKLGNMNKREDRFLQRKYHSKEAQRTHVYKYTSTDDTPFDMTQMGVGETEREDLTDNLPELN